MATIVGVTLLSTAAAVAGGYFYKKKEPSTYDAALFINYKSASPQPSDLATTLYWKHCADTFLDDVNDKPINVAVLGDYKQGKTFVLNGMSGLLLDTSYTSTMEGVKFKKASWMSSHKQELSVILIDTEGLNHLPGDATNKELMAKRLEFDKLMMEMVVRIADVHILVTDKPSISFWRERMGAICKHMVHTKSTRTLAIVYNLCNVENKDDLLQFFEREVVIRYNCSKYENTMPLVSHHYSNDTIEGEKFRIVHLPLAREGSEAGKHVNKNTFESLKYLVEVEAQRRDDKGERKTMLKEQLAGLAPLFRHSLGVDLPKENMVPYIPKQKPVG